MFFVAQLVFLQIGIGVASLSCNKLASVTLGRERRCLLTCSCWFCFTWCWSCRCYGDFAQPAWSPHIEQAGGGSRFPPGRPKSHVRRHVCSKREGVRHAREPPSNQR